MYIGALTSVGQVLLIQTKERWNLSPRNHQHRILILLYAY